MIAARLFVGALLRLAILASIVWLALHDRTWMAAALIALFLLTPLDVATKPTTRSSTAAAPPATPTKP